MTEFKREFFKKDPEVTGKLWELIKQRHEVAKHTEKVLFENRHIKDFCEESRTFVDMGRGLYIHYDVASWYHEEGAQVKIEAICIYDDFMEYEKARMYQLHKASHKDIPNIN